MGCFTRLVLMLAVVIALLAAGAATVRLWPMSCWGLLLLGFAAVTKRVHAAWSHGTARWATEQDLRQRGML